MHGNSTNLEWSFWSSPSQCLILSCASFAMPMTQWNWIQPRRCSTSVWLCMKGHEMSKLPIHLKRNLVTQSKNWQKKLITSFLPFFNWGTILDLLQFQTLWARRMRFAAVVHKFEAVSEPYWYFFNLSFLIELLLKMLVDIFLL